jgi:hypothetical protein
MEKKKAVVIENILGPLDEPIRNETNRHSF